MNKLEEVFANYGQAAMELEMVEEAGIETAEFEDNMEAAEKALMEITGADTIEAAVAMAEERTGIEFISHN